jgi:hypothetical protein
VIALPHFRPAFAGIGFDPDALAYIAAVEAADGQSLESATRLAINAFVKGCKTDGIWNAIKASCILAGARTLSGALVPLRGSAPTNFNFVSGDYNRKTGLVGNGSTKYLNSGRANNADPQNNKHNAVFVNSTGSIPTCFLGAGDSNISGSDQLLVTNTTTMFTSRNRGSGSIFQAGPNGSLDSCLYGNTRSSSSSIITRANSNNYPESLLSTTPLSSSILVFARGNVSAPLTYSSGRLSFYSIGESLDLAALDSRVSTLMTSINSAIP